MLRPEEKLFYATEPLSTAEVRPTDVAAEVVADGDESWALVNELVFAVLSEVGLPIAVYQADHDE